MTNYLSILSCEIRTPSTPLTFSKSTPTFNSLLRDQIDGVEVGDLKELLRLSILSCEISEGYFDGDCAVLTIFQFSLARSEVPDQNESTLVDLGFQFSLARSVYKRRFESN